MPHAPCPKGLCPGPAPSPSHPGTFVVEMEELFSGWIEVRNMSGKPHSTVTFKVSTDASTEMEFNMQDTYTFGASGRGSFRMRFACEEPTQSPLLSSHSADCRSHAGAADHEIHYVTITGLEHPPALTDVVGVRLTSLGAQVRFLTEVLDDFRRFVDEIWQF